MASLMRSALQVPLSPRESPAQGPLNYDWHQQDQDKAPAGCPFVASSNGDELRVSRPPKGRAGVTWYGVAACIVVGIASIVLPHFAMPHTKTADDRQVVWFITFGLAAIVLLVLVGMLDEVRSYYTIVADGNGVKIERRIIFGLRVREFHRHELSAISTRLTAVFEFVVYAIKNTGEQSRVISGKPDPMRYLATLLRRKMNLPASPAAKM